MNRWEAPESIFAPIIAAVPPGTAWAGFGNSLIAAAESVPHAAVPYNVKLPGSFKRTSETHQRMLLHSTGEQAKPFQVRATLVDKPPARQVSNLASIRLWEVGMTHLRDGLCAPAVPEDFDSAILQVSKFQIIQLGLRGAPQLALLRHLWAEAVRTASPDAILFGGQRHWQEDWWIEQITESVA